MTIDYKGHKIFAFSDTHGIYRKLEVPSDADILICAGDACEGFNPADLQDFFSWYNPYLPNSESSFLGITTASFIRNPRAPETLFLVG